MLIVCRALRKKQTKDAPGSKRPASLAKSCHQRIIHARRDSRPVAHLYASSLAQSDWLENCQARATEPVFLRVSNKSLLSHTGLKAYLTENSGHPCHIIGTVEGAVLSTTLFEARQAGLELDVYPDAIHIIEADTHKTPGERGKDRLGS